LLLLVPVLLSSCDRFGNKEADGKKDLRIISLSKHLTEMVFALGKGHDLVAVDLSSTFPDSAKLLKTVCYHRALSPESIIAMNPELVIHSNDIGPENVLPQTKNAGLNTKVFGGANTIDGAKLLLKDLGNFLGEDGKTDSIIKKMDNDLAIAADSVKALNLNVIDNPVTGKPLVIYN
jgi:iron complex transport system substrate-binding protein